MDDADYSLLRMRLMAHQVLLVAVMAAHPDKARLSACVAEVLDQMQSQLLPSRLADEDLAAFDQEVRSILNKAGQSGQDWRTPPR